MIPGEGLILGPPMHFLKFFIFFQMREIPHKDKLFLAKSNVGHNRMHHTMVLHFNKMAICLFMINARKKKHAKI
jgi:hypothetical protein